MSEKKRKQFFKYSEEDLERAIDAVRHSGMKLREAERRFNVPHSTLINKLKQKTELKRRMGPSTVIPKVEEELLETFIIASAKKGFPISRRRLMLLAQEITNRKLGRKWFQLFLKRHGTISKRHAENINAARAAVTESSIRTWHENLRQYVKEEFSAEDIFNDPARIINSDESGFMINPKSGVVLGPKGEKNLYEVAIGSEKEQITTLLTISADGHVFPPLVVLPFERVPAKVAEQYNPNWAFGNSKSGWMTSEVYLGYVRNSLLPELTSKGVKFPVLYLVDGHKSHLSYELAKFCDESGIILYSFRPNATHILQPADVAVFRSLKHNWSKEVEDFRSEHKYQPITKGLFGPLLEKALMKITKETVSNGFKICGLYPFDADSIDYSKCMENVSRTMDRGVKLKPAQLGFSHLLHVESCMRYGRTQEFRKTYAEAKKWEGDESALELYNVWYKIRKSLENEEVEDVSTYEKELFQAEAEPGLNQLEASPSQPQPGTSQEEELVEAEAEPSPYQLEASPSQPLPGTSQQSNEPLTFHQLQANKDISPQFYKNVVWPEDTPPKNPKKRLMKFPQGSGARKWLQYYEEKKKSAEENEAKKLAKLQERNRKREEKKRVKALKKRKAVHLDESSDEGSNDDQRFAASLADSSGGEWVETDEDELDEEAVLSAFWSDGEIVKKEDWVLVEFQGKKGNLIFYAGKVLEKTENKAVISFLKKTRGAAFVFPEVKDEASIDTSRIKKILPPPAERRGYFTFNIKFPPSLLIV